MLNKYLLIVSALVAVLAYFVLYEKTETGPTEQNYQLLALKPQMNFQNWHKLVK